MKRVYDQQPATPKSESEYLADEIESVGRGLGIKAGRLLLPEEDALIVKALRAFAQSESAAIVHCPRCGYPEVE